MSCASAAGLAEVGGTSTVSGWSGGKGGLEALGRSVGGPECVLLPPDVSALGRGIGFCVGLGCGSLGFALTVGFGAGVSGAAAAILLSAAALTAA